jgi:hypothetical protein
MNSSSGSSIGDNATVTNSAVALGAGAIARNVVSCGPGSPAEAEELARQVDRLVALLDEGVTTGQLPAEVAATGREVKNQLAADQPNKFTILSLLAGIAGGAGSLTTIVNAVGAVQGMIGKLF